MIIRNEFSRVFFALLTKYFLENIKYLSARPCVNSDWRWFPFILGTCRVEHCMIPALQLSTILWLHISLNKYESIYIFLPITTSSSRWAIIYLECSVPCLWYRESISLNIGFGVFVIPREGEWLFGFLGELEIRCSFKIQKRFRLRACYCPQYEMTPYRQSVLK